MDSATSYSGIKAIGDLKWGTHICSFYRTQDDLIDSVVPYFQAGLKFIPRGLPRAL